MIATLGIMAERGTLILLAACLVHGWEKSQLPEQSKSIPIHPAFYHPAYLDPVNPDSRRRGALRQTDGITRDHLIGFCNQVNVFRYYTRWLHDSKLDQLAIRKVLHCEVDITIRETCPS